MAEKSAATHDTGPPQNLLTFMMSGWATPPGTPASPVEGIERFAARRDALSRSFPGETLIVPTGHEKVRANDTNHRFRPGTDFVYLTGNAEPDNVLVLTPRDGGHDATLYCEPNPGKTDATFFTDRAKGELWVGPRLGLPQTRAALRHRDEAGRDAEGRARRRARARSVPPAARHRPRARRRGSGAGGRPRRELRDGAVRDASHQGRARGTRAAAGDRRDAPRLRRRRPGAAARRDRAHDRRRVQPARARRGQRHRLPHDRRDRSERVHAALDAQRPAHRRGRAAAAGCRRGGGDAVHGRHHAHAADLRRVHAGAARDLRARPRGAGRGVRAVRAGQRLPRPEPRRDGRPRARPRTSRDHRVGRRRAAGREPVLSAVLAAQRQPHARASTCTIAPRRAPRRTSSGSSRPGWC